jgi:hypothetical protein
MGVCPDQESGAAARDRAGGSGGEAAAEEGEPGHEAEAAEQGQAEEDEDDVRAPEIAGGPSPGHPLRRT